MIVRAAVTAIKRHHIGNFEELDRASRVNSSPPIRTMKFCSWTLPYAKLYASLSINCMLLNRQWSPRTPDNLVEHLPLLFLLRVLQPVHLLRAQSICRFVLFFV